MKDSYCSSRAAAGLDVSSRRTAARTTESVDRCGIAKFEVQEGRDEGGSESLDYLAPVRG